MFRVTFVFRISQNLIKPFFKNFEAPQRSVEIKISVNFYFNTTFEMHGAGRVKQH